MVAFRCILQDTGYPFEMYCPSPVDHPKAYEVTSDRLKERWVGWGTEYARGSILKVLTSVHRIPGEQSWARPSVPLGSPENVSSGSSTMINNQSLLPHSVHSKYPLPGRGGNYLGALIKVCNESLLVHAKRIRRTGLRRRLIPTGVYVHFRRHRIIVNYALSALLV